MSAGPTAERYRFRVKAVASAAPPWLSLPARRSSATAEAGRYRSGRAPAVPESAGNTFALA
jgi:hypothetical protein